MTDTDLQSKLTESESIIAQLVAKLQETIDENDRLRAELARATEGAGALATLQSLYRNGELPESLRAKCAGLALSHESAPLKPVSQLELTAEPAPLPLAEVVRLQRARTKALEGLPLGHPKYKDWVWDADQSKWSEQVARLTGGDGNDSAGNSGTGSDYNTGS
jgi:hypothetical protein